MDTGNPDPTHLPPGARATRERRVYLDADGRPTVLWERCRVDAPPARSPPQIPARAGPDAAAKAAPSRHHRPRFDLVAAVGSVLVAGLGVAAMWWVEHAYSAGPLLLYWVLIFFARGPLRATGLTLWSLFGWALVSTDPLASGAYFAVTWAVGGVYWEPLFGPGSGP